MIRKRFAALLIPLAILMSIIFIVIVVNQSFQLVALAERAHPVAGDIVFWGIVAVFAICLGVPLFVLLTMPSALQPPTESEGPAFDRHVQRLRRRLERNPHVSGTLADLPELEKALAQLDTLADARTKAAATQVFMMTAISQNGSLDALLVLGLQSKLILQIARTYYQRPTIRDLIYLYSNVSATAFIAAELEDVDLSEQIQPVVTAVLGSTVAAVPGMSAAAGLFVNSVTTGAGNAYLTLRVGIITRQYCRSLVRPERSAIRRLAAVQAARLLGGIAREGAASVAAALWSRPKRYFSDLIESASSSMGAVRGAVMAKGAETWNALTGKRRGPGEPEPTAD